MIPHQSPTWGNLQSLSLMRHSVVLQCDPVWKSEGKGDFCGCRESWWNHCCMCRGGGGRGSEQHRKRGGAIQSCSCASCSCDVYLCALPPEMQSPKEKKINLNQDSEWERSPSSTWHFTQYLLRPYSVVSYSVVSYIHTWSVKGIRRSYIRSGHITGIQIQSWFSVCISETWARYGWLCCQERIWGSSKWYVVA